MKLIDAEKLVALLAAWQRALSPGSSHTDAATSRTLQGVIDLIVTAPCVGAEPVRHGRWTNIAGYTACSECGCSPADWEPKSDNPLGLPPYCHSCGAKMDKEEEA